MDTSTFLIPEQLMEQADRLRYLNSTIGPYLSLSKLYENKGNLDKCGCDTCAQNPENECLPFMSMEKKILHGHSFVYLFFVFLDPNSEMRTFWINLMKKVDFLD